MSDSRKESYMKPNWADAPKWANHLIQINHEYYWLEYEPPLLQEAIKNTRQYPEHPTTIWINSALPIKGRIQRATTPYIWDWNCEERPSKAKEV